MGEFLNQYVTDLHTGIPLGAGAIFVLAIFSILYNRWMTDLGEKKDGYTAIFVAVGNLATLLIVAVFSWKAALITLIAFVASGTAMIIGDIHRSVSRREETAKEAKKQVRRKPLPYAAARLIAESYDELIAVERKLETVVTERKYELIPLILAGVSKSLRHISEAKNTEGE